MYDVHPRRWVKVSRMHFKGDAARWIESLEHPDRIPWPDFCKLIHERFGRDQRDKLSRQMLHIHQMTTVTDYVARFSTLFDQLKNYQPNPDMHYYTTRFIDGLRHDIRIVVALQRPQTLDTAYSLALLQEELGEPSTMTEFHAFSRGASFKGGARAAMNMPRLPPPPAPPADKPVPKTVHPATEDKLSALRTYRRARGLSDVCAEKWFRGHKCAAAIPLHAMQEIWDLFQLEAFSEPQEPDQDSPETPPEQLFLALSHDAQRGAQGCRTIQFQGTILGRPVAVLIDSGSSASFLVVSVADRFSQLQRTPLS